MRDITESVANIAVDALREIVEMYDPHESSGYFECYEAQTALKKIKALGWPQRPQEKT